MLAAMIPAEDSPEAIEGRAAHWVAEQLLNDCKIAGTDANLDYQQHLGVSTPEGVIVTQDFIDGAKLYVEEIASVMEPLGKWHELFIEEHVFTSIHAECHGTPDAFFYDLATGTLYIWDFKYGHGDIDPFENWQLICYYDGARLVYQIDGVMDQSLKVKMCIVQPRCYTANGPVKYWDVIGSDLRGPLNILRAAAERCVAPGAMTKSGNQCRHCLARYVCKSNQQQALDGVTYLNTAAPSPLTDQALAVELATLQNAIKDLKYREGALQDEATARTASGAKLHGFIRQDIMGHRKFTADPDVVDIIGQSRKITLIAEPKLVTPAEAERRLKKTGMSQAQIDSALAGLTIRPTSGSRVVMDKGVEARRIFTKPLE